VVGHEPASPGAHAVEGRLEIASAQSLAGNFGCDGLTNAKDITEAFG
jgi:hypothetical protein